MQWNEGGRRGIGLCYGSRLQRSGDSHPGHGVGAIGIGCNPCRFPLPGDQDIPQACRDVMDIDALYSGDCLTWLKTLKPESVYLVYLDAPFFTQRVQKSKTRDTSQEYGFAGTLARIEKYTAFMKQRIVE